MYNCIYKLKYTESDHTYSKYMWKWQLICYMHFTTMKIYPEHLFMSIHIRSHFLLKSFLHMLWDGRTMVYLIGPHWWRFMLFAFFLSTVIMLQGSLNNRNVLPHHFRSWKSKMKVSSGLFSSASSLLGWQVAIFSFVSRYPFKSDSTWVVFLYRWIKTPISLWLFSSVLGGWHTKSLKGTHAVLMW